MSSVVERLVKEETVISLKPIIREGWLPKGHDGEYKFTGCETWETPTKDGRTGQLRTGLTSEDEERLEKKLRLSAGTLNRYNTDFWATFKVKIPKEGRTFYMDNPRDELEVLTLRANPRIANSAMEVLDSPGATHYLTSVEKEAEVENAKDASERTAIKHYMSMSAQTKAEVLKVYGLLEGKTTIKITKNTPENLIESTLYKKLKENPEEFMRISTDPSFNTRVLIDNLIEKRILIKSGSKYVVHGGDTIGATLQDTIDFLENPHNQDVLISLKGKLEAIE